MPTPDQIVQALQNLSFADYSQIAIMLLGGAAIWLVGRREHWSRWGFVVGLVSQPFWLYSAWTSKQWGVFVLSIWFTYAWAQGIYLRWFAAEDAGQRSAV